MLAALAEMWAGRTKFLVAGRESGGKFRTLKEVEVPEGFEPLFSDLPENQFREDVSSTQIRVTQGD